MKKNYNNTISIFFTKNITIITFIIILTLSFYYFVKSIKCNNNDKIIIQQKNISSNDNPYGLFTKPNYGYTNIPGDVLLNPYVPPLKDERYIIDERIKFNNVDKVPINTNTNIGYVDTNYRQLGILTSIKGDKQKILPLLGKPLYSNRNKWNYYTQEEKNNIKLPIIFKKKSCTSDYGCEEIYNGDSVFVKGYNTLFKVEMYDNDTIRYLPFF